MVSSGQNSLTAFVNAFEALNGDVDFTHGCGSRRRWDKLGGRGREWGARGRGVLFGSLAGVGCRMRFCPARAHRGGAGGIGFHCRQWGDGGFEHRQLLIEKGLDQAFGLGPEAVVTFVEIRNVQADASR